MSDILFILKRKESLENQPYTNINSSGLSNSANFVNDMLNKIDMSSAVEIAIDNNCIDRLVTEHSPKIVIIEALWVVPEKFNVLVNLHPDVKWIVRLHSEISFMSQEGIAYDWIIKSQMYKNVFIGTNSVRMKKSLEKLNRSTQNDKEILYLPNYYDTSTFVKKEKVKKDWIDIGCFGAIRPLKNHMIQALAAIEYAEKKNIGLRFHINSTRLEMKGEPILHNLRALFDNHFNHELVEHEWLEHDEFTSLCKEMDAVMQVSYSETFNIVAADALSVGTPILVSDEVPFSSWWFTAKVNDQTDICKKLSRVIDYSYANILAHKSRLMQYNESSMSSWKKLISL